MHELTASLKPGGWAIFNVPVTTTEGEIYALSELLNRRRAYLLSTDEILNSTIKAGLRADYTATAGLSRGGLTLTFVATVPAASTGSPV